MDIVCRSCAIDRAGGGAVRPHALRRDEPPTPQRDKSRSYAHLHARIIFLNRIIGLTIPPGRFRKHAHEQQGSHQRPETEGQVLLQERTINLPLYQGREHSSPNADGYRLQQEITAAFRRAQVSEYAHKKPEEKHEKYDKCQQAKDSYAYPYM